MKNLRRISLICLSLTLTACVATSRPLQHLQLSAGEVSPATGDTPVLFIDAVSLPNYLLRSELLYREDAYSLRYDPFQRWAEPLDLGIQRVVGARLESMLSTRQVVRFPDVPSATAGWILRVDVKHFETRDGNVLLSAEGRWSRADSPESTAAVVEFEESQSVSTNDGGAIAAALSQLLWDFSDALGEALQPYPPAAGAPILLQ